MKKEIEKKGTARGQHEVGHLDQTLTAATLTLTQRLKEWRIPLVSALVILLLGYGAYKGFQVVSDVRTTTLNERLYALLDSPEARREGYTPGGYTPDKGAIDALLADARGKPFEKVAIYKVIDYYVDRAGKIIEKDREAKAAAKDSSLSMPNEKKPEPPTAAELAQLEEFRDQALALADDAARRFSADTEIQSFASKLREKFESERKSDWLPAPWKFAPPLPKPLEEPEKAGAAPASAPAAAAAPAGASSSTPGGATPPADTGAAAAPAEPKAPVIPQAPPAGESSAPPGQAPTEKK